MLAHLFGNEMFNENRKNIFRTSGIVLKRDILSHLSFTLLLYSLGVTSRQVFSLVDKDVYTILYLILFMRLLHQVYARGSVPILIRN